MDLGSILAVAQQQRSIPGLLSMLRGGDVQGVGGGGGLAQPGPMTPMGGGGGANTSQLQVAQSAMDGSGQNNWAPQWVIDEWNRTPADSTRPSDRSGEAQGITQGQLAPQYNPANWGPPPPLNEGPSSWFPSAFNNRDPRYSKFWTMKGYDAQRGGQLPEVGDERPNSFNIGNGNFMVLGHEISPAKLQYDLHRPISDPATAGSIHFSRQFGPDQTAWSTTGELGLPGQLEPFATMWGAGSP